ncbi:MAG: DUF3343 domain-containing protein [Deltaproteobacteria bacterium]|nr:DUF3343 domain-containing protein [Deltaproteobacteria bacterium]PWB60681.1 MAG: hypothetical protein C3F14_12760 [Deltaproteobacteria bacterium]
MASAATPIHAMWASWLWVPKMSPSGITNSLYNNWLFQTADTGGFPLGRPSHPEMILIFRGTHQVLSAEKHLKKAGVPMRLIPAPKWVTSDCGLAIRIHEGDRGRARAALSAAKILPISAHLLREKGGYETVAF